LFKSNLDREKDIKTGVMSRINNEENNNYNQYNEEDYNYNTGNEKFNDKEKENNYDNTTSAKNAPALAFDEIKVDYEGILVLYLNITNMKPIDMDDKKSEIFTKNFYISHKIFPGAEVSTSDIKFNSTKPNFNYQMLMPFTLNSRSIELLETGFMLIEVWHKGNYEDELLGTVKLELNPILESLKISEDTLSITPISKNMLPLVVYDGFYPVYNYEEFSNVFYLNLTLGFGTTTQVNNYIRKNKNLNSPNLENIANTNGDNNQIFKEENTQNKESNAPANINETTIKPNNNLKSSNKEDDFNYLNNLLNAKDKNDLKDPNLNNEKNFTKNETIRNEEIDVEDILERNKKCYEDLNNKYKVTTSTMNDKENSKKYEGNPFLVNNSNNNNFNDIMKINNSLEREKEYNLNLNNSYKNEEKYNPFEKKPIFLVSKESNFYIKENDRVKSDNVILDKLTENDFFKSGKMQKIENMNLNNTIPDFKTLNINANTHEDSKNEKIEKFEKSLQKETHQLSQLNNYNDSVNLHQNLLIKHSFEIYIDKLINLQVLSKLPTKSYIKYKFLSGSDSENETWVKSDSLQYSSYDKQSSTIEVDLKSQHSILLSSLEKIKDHLGMDFIILFAYLLNEEEVIFARVCIPSEEIISILNSTANEISSYYCIYGTEKIKRNDCIIGKMKLSIKYEKSTNTPIDQSSGNILLERQIIFNRKIPKNASLKFKLNYFKYDENFLSVYNPELNKGTSVFYLQIDPFGEDKMLKKSFPKQRSSKKYNSLNGIFEEEFSYNLLIESDILEYLKNKNSLVNLVVYTKQHNFFNSSAESRSDSDSDSSIGINLNSQKCNFKEIVGTAKIKLSEIISNTDFTNRTYNIFSKEGVKLGCVNLEIKIENNLENVDEENNRPDKKKSSNINNKKLKLENLKEILTQKNQKSNFDGKYFLVINLLNFIYDENSGISKRLENKKFYLQYKFGKNIKKVSPIYEINNSSSSHHLIDSPIINLFNLNFLEFLEMTISFSKNKPEDVIKALMENIFEIKLYFHEDNEHIGSFMIDLSKILSPQCKLTNTNNTYNQNIFHSGMCNINYYDIDNKKIENLKLCMSLSLLKSDLSLSQFSKFFNNCLSLFNNKDNIDLLKNSKDEIEKNFKNILEKISEKDDKVNYEYIDLHLFPLEDDNGELLIENMNKFIFMFSNINHNSQIFDHLELINNFFYNHNERKLNLKKGLSNKGYIITKEKIVSNNLFNNDNEEMKKIVEIFSQEENKIQFGIYTHNNQEDNCIDLLDFLFYLYKFSQVNLESQYVYNPLLKYNQRSAYNSQPSSTLTIFIYSASNLTLENSSFNIKPNSYFTLQWGEDSFTSDVVIKTSHPSWNQKLEVVIGLNNIKNKFSSDILISFFNKLERDSNSNISTYSYDEFIGEVRINLMEIYRMKFFNLKGEYEDFFNIMNNERIRGQLNTQFILDEMLAQALGKENVNESNISYTGSQFPSLRENTFNNNYNYNRSSLPMSLTSNKNYQNEDVSHLDTESLWDKINKNTVKKNNK
jgi:hypothetical protein